MKKLILLSFLAFGVISLSSCTTDSYYSPGYSTTYVATPSFTYPGFYGIGWNNGWYHGYANRGWYARNRYYHGVYGRGWGYHNWHSNGWRNVSWHRGFRR